MQHTNNIRIASPDDFERIVALENLCFPKEFAYTRRQLRYLSTKANSLVFVETAGNLIRGFIIIVFRKGTSVAGIETINVDPAFQKRGIGHQLLSFAEEHLKKRKIQKIRLEVSITNQAAISLYEHAGFRKISLLKNYYHFNHNGSYHAYRMIKKLR
jgi:ribosomal protein S18 acetylase RimI-like enzyme